MSIHLDNHYVAKPSDHLFSQMMPMAKRHWKSSASLHDGLEPQVSINKAHERIKTLLGGGQLYITADPLLTLHTALFIDYIKPSGKNQVITPYKDTFEGLGCICKWGQSIEELITPRTALVSVPWANVLTGAVMPIWELTELCKKHEILLHVDVSAVIGKLFFQFDSIDIDFLSFSAAPFHGPKGIGGILSKRPLSIKELEPNLLALIGMGIAAEEALDNLDHVCLEIARLRSLLESSGEPLCATTGRLPNIAAIRFPGIDPELLQFSLAHSGLFCFREDDCLSFCLTRDTLEEEIRSAIGIIDSCRSKYEAILQ